MLRMWNDQTGHTRNLQAKFAIAIASLTDKGWPGADIPDGVRSSAGFTGERRAWLCLP
jgi:hypothetical protein